LTVNNLLECSAVVLCCTTKNSIELDFGFEVNFGANFTAEFSEYY